MAMIAPTLTVPTRLTHSTLPASMGDRWVMAGYVQSDTTVQEACPVSTPYHVTTGLTQMKRAWWNARLVLLVSLHLFIQRCIVFETPVIRSFTRSLKSRYSYLNFPIIGCLFCRFLLPVQHGKLHRLPLSTWSLVSSRYHLLERQPLSSGLFQQCYSQGGSIGLHTMSR